MSHTAINRNKSSNHFAAIFNYATMGIMIVDFQGKIIAVNPFALKEFGYKENELIGKAMDILIPVRYKEKHKLYHKQYFKDPQSRPMGSTGVDLFAIKKDGTEIPVEISLSYYHDEQNEKYVLAFITNILERKKAEAEILRFNDKLETLVTQRTKDLEETLQDLAVSRNELEKAIYFQKALFDNAGAIIISVNENGIIQTFNHEAERELGYRADEVVGKYYSWIFHDHDLIRQRIEEISMKLQKDIPASIEIFFAKEHFSLQNVNEWLYVRKDGTKFPVQLAVTALKDKQNEIMGFMGIAFNITKQKKTEQELQEALKKEKELGELKSRFVSMASHEFRTPLSTVLSSAYLIERYTTTEDQAKREKHVQRIVSSVNMLTDILNDFLSVGKIEEGKIQVRFLQFNIRDLVIAVADEMKISLKKKQNIRYHHQGKQFVMLDPSFLKHIVMNLVSNASKFSSETSVIEIKTVAHDDYIILSVKDHGIGISRQDQAHLMERFFRGTNAANIQGTGLGLHIVLRYAELMNGTVECKSELEKGTEFIITFNPQKS